MPKGDVVYAVITASAPLYRCASRRSPQETELLLGEGFRVEIVSRGWAKGQAISPIKRSIYAGYSGYVPVKHLSETIESVNYIVTALAAPVFSKPDIKSRVTAMWSMNARFKADSAGDFYECAFGYIHRRHARKINVAVAQTDFTAIAEDYIGRPYIWAGVSAVGLDCSGLVQTALRAWGHDAPRDSGDQAAMGVEIAADETLKRGDLIFWAGHVGIMQDAERILHANAHHMKVASEPLQEAIDRIAKAYGPVTAKRRLSL